MKPRAGCTLIPPSVKIKIVGCIPRRADTITPETNTPVQIAVCLRHIRCILQVGRIPHVGGGYDGRPVSAGFRQSLILSYTAVFEFSAVGVAPLLVYGGVDRVVRDGSDNEMQRNDPQRSETKEWKQK